MKGIRRATQPETKTRGRFAMARQAPQAQPAADTPASANLAREELRTGTPEPSSRPTLSDE